MVKSYSWWTIFVITLSFFPRLQAQEADAQLKNLDSLYYSWAESRLMIPVTLIPADLDSTIGDAGPVEDSVYIRRLQAIPTILDLTFNSQVKRYIAIYTEKRKKQVELLLGLADYYFPMFEEILMRKGLPIELKYMPIIESGLNPVATSRVGAQGLWQFMYRTAKSYGLQMNSFVDERWDPIRSSEAAISYLKDLYDIYQDWYLVIAAYNCGPGNVNKAIRRSGGKTNYWEIYYHLPRETRGYVPAFIAVIYAMNYHYAHGITPAKVDFPVITDTVWINQDLHFKQLSAVMEIPLKTIEILNPQYRRDIIPGVGGPYSLRLPYDRLGQFIDEQDSIYNYKKEIYFSNINSTRSPTYSHYIPDPPKGDYVGLEYIVKQGDVLGYVAEWYDVGLSRLRYWNNIYGNTIRVGQKLTVYVPKGQVDKYKRINDLSFSEKHRLFQGPS